MAATRERQYNEAIEALATSMHDRFWADEEAPDQWDRNVVEHILADFLELPLHQHSAIVATMGLRQAGVILTATSRAFGYSEAELCSPSRAKRLVLARQIAMYICREVTDLSYAAIASAFGRSDHTTVMHAVQKIEKEIGENRKLRDLVAELRRIVERA